MNKIILTKGIQGSGKTTWAKAWVAEDPEHRIRINNDDITSMWGQPFGTPGLYDRLTYIRKAMLLRAMRENLDIVLDNMNLSNRAINEVNLLIIDKDYNNYTVEYKDFTDVPLEECIERDSKRENPIGEKIIRDTYNKYIKNN